MELIRLLVASVAVLLLPGLFLSAPLRKSLSLQDPVESTLLSLIASYAVILLTSVALAVFHSNLNFVGVAWLVLLIPVSVVQARRLTFKLPPILWVCLGVVFFLGWNLEPTLKGEELLELIPIRKILENSTVSFFNLSQFPDTAGIYLFFPYYFLLALISKISLLPLEFVYIKMRSVYAVISLLGFYGLSLRLFRDKDLANLAVLVLTLLIVVNPGPWEWPASLFPLCRRGGFAMGVLLPLAAWLVLVLGCKPIHWSGMMLAMVFSLAFASTHPLELAMFFFFPLACLITRPAPDRAAAGSVLVSFLVGALIFRAAQAQLHLLAMQIEGEARAALLHNTLHWLSTPVQALLGGVPLEGRYVISNTGAITVYSFLSVLFLPWLLGSNPRTGTLLGLTVLVPLACYTTPLGVSLMSYLTSAAVVQDVVGYFSLFGLLIVIGATPPLLFFTLSQARKFTPRADPWIALGFSAVVVAPISAAFLVLLQARPECGLLVGGLGLIGGLKFASTPRGDPGLRLNLLFLLPLVVGLSLSRERSSVPKNNAFERLSESYRLPSVASWQSYYPHFQANLRPQLDLPLEVVQDLSKLLKAEQVVIHDPVYSMSLAVVFNCYVINPDKIYGHYFMPAIPYMQRFVHDGVHPIYNSGPNLSAEEEEFLKVYAVRYVFVNPGWQDMAQRKLDPNPQRLTKIYSQLGFSVYEVRP